VLLLHHKIFNNGWMGVDLFFVLSGFLITGILRKDRDRAFYWKRFYIKRATRILPPMLLTCVLAFIFTPGAKLWLVLGYIFTLGGIIDLYPKIFIEPIGPLWSLAVEEHFYLVWPFAVRFLHKKHALALLGAVIVFDPLLRAAFSHPMPTANLSVTYFLTPFRIDEMAFGCLLALLIESETYAKILARYSGIGLAAATVLYFGLWFKLQHIYFYPGGHTKLFDSLGYSLVAFASFCLVAHVYLNRDSFTARFLSFGPLAFLGRISYGIYLYHLLIREFIMWFLGIDSQKVAFVFDFPLIVLLSWVSFKYYEQPLIEWGRRRAAMLDRAHVQALPDAQQQGGYPNNLVVLHRQDSL
jgi:peptidoglycan/LPS O-acetylase OafA/YrhL